MKTLDEEISVSVSSNGAVPNFDVEKIRADFPILSLEVHGKPLAYLDNAATTQKPRVVIDAIRRYYEAENANIHRGVYYLSELATKKYEDSRKFIQKFINAKSAKEIIFTRGTSESVNLVAATFGRTNVGEGDEIVITGMEHHSNIVPWQLLCEEKGAKLRIAPIDDDGDVIFEEFEKLLNDRTKLVAAVYVSNSLGTVNPVREMIQAAHEREIPVLLDAAQALPHLAVDVQELDCDFLAFSGHKVFGPTGIGVLYGKEALLDKMPPYQGGGDMILSVTFEKTTFNELPYKFEAGTPNIADGIALSEALKYIEKVGYERIQKHECDLLAYGEKTISEIDGVRMIGTAKNKAGVLSFVVEDVHPHDIGTMLDHDGIAVRTGHHCTQPVMDRYNIPATTRASLALYNTREELDRLAAGLRKIIEVFR